MWQELAEQQLSDAVALFDNIEARLEKAKAALQPLLAAVDARNDEADAVLGRVSDEIWNEVGRPAADPALSVLFPGGIAYYADGNVEKQPGRMDLLAELLESRIHPRLSPAQVKAHAAEIRASAKQLRTAVDALAEPNERVDLLQRVRRALASVAHADLTSLKRLYKNAHFSQADIHGVIDRRLGESPDRRRLVPRRHRRQGPSLLPESREPPARDFSHLHACRRRFPCSTAACRRCRRAVRARDRPFTRP